MSRAGGGRGLGCLAVSLLALCALAALGYLAVVAVPSSISQDFGPPSPRLGTVQRLTLAWELYGSRDNLLQPVDPQGTEQEFSIRMGETANSIAARLEDARLVRSGDSFRNYLVYSGLDTSIQAGNYKLSSAMSAVDLARQLQDATPQEVEFNVLAGWRAEEIAAVLPTSGLQIAPDGFLQVVKNPAAGLAPSELGVRGSLEGFLLPGSYRLSRDTRADELVKTLVTQFDQQVGSDLREAFKSHGLNLLQAVTLASIVQREAVVSEEQPIIASVFYNRLAKGMKLDSDPTVQYALGFDAAHSTWWTNPLSSGDLTVNSPYNTYVAAGLPPGPISNPSLSALKAVAYPAQTPYYYFRASCDQSGKHTFSKTYEEHLQNACP